MIKLAWFQKWNSIIKRASRCFDQVPNNRIPKFGEWDSDVGVGIDTGGLGLYAARALTRDEPIRLILRLQRRF